MNDERVCETEPAVIAALRGHAMTDELLAHIEQCDRCAEAMLIASSLQQVAPLHQVQPPDAAVIWWHSQEFARRKAIAKAVAPIRVAQVCACVVAVVAAIWLASSVPHISAWISDLGWQPLAITEHNFSNLWLQSTIFGLIPSVLLVGFSSWYLLRHE